MRTTRQLSITLPTELAQMVRGRVESGEYASESEVIRDGLRALLAREKAVETWLTQQAIPALEAIRADPSRGRTVAEVRATLATEHERATKGR